MNKLLTIYFIFSIIILSYCVHAQLSCSVESGSCSGTAIPIFKMSSTSNAHAELASESNYNELVCCDLPGVTIGTSCTGGADSAVVLHYSSSTNAHVEKSSESNYLGNEICLSGPAGSTVVCDYDTDCSNLGADYACLASISANTNAHVGVCDLYITNICCEVSTAGGSGIGAGKHSIPLLPDIYYVDDTINYEMYLKNDDPLGYTWTRIWDTMPDDTVIEFLGPGETLDQPPGAKNFFYANYIVDAADAIWDSVLGYWTVYNDFEGEGIDSSGGDGYLHVAWNSRIIRPDTQVSISAVLAGNMVDLTVTEQNTGYDPLNDTSVTVNDGTSDIAILDSTNLDMGDTNLNDVLDVDETWSWTITGIAIYETTTFTATGYAIDPLSNPVTFPQYGGEQDSVIVEPCQLVSASINPNPGCAGGLSINCEEGETIQMSASYIGQCTDALVNHFQIDAKDDDVSPTCDIQYTGGDIDGITDTDTGSLTVGATIIGSWQIPNPIPADCYGKEVFAYAAAIRDDIPGSETFLSFVQDAVITDNSPVDGSFTFIAPLLGSCQDDCTRVGEDNIDAACDGVEVDGIPGITKDGDCVFCDQYDAIDPQVRQKAKDACHLQKPTWIRPYTGADAACLSGDCEIQCAEECPQDEVRTPATITCTEENIMQTRKPITYKGKLVRMVIVTCG